MAIRRWQVRGVENASAKQRRQREPTVRAVGNCIKGNAYAIRQVCGKPWRSEPATQPVKRKVPSRRGVVCNPQVNRIR